MMVPQSRILIVENQYSQYERIKDFLVGGNILCFPSEENEFKSFIDWVHICLNQRYPEARRGDCLERIVKYVNETAMPHLVIMDHLLVGNHEAEKGIDLAIKLQERGIELPIVFMSRSSKYEYRVNESLNRIKSKYLWLPKGSPGDEVLSQKHLVQIIGNDIINWIIQS